MNYKQHDRSVSIGGKTWQFTRDEFEEIYTLYFDHANLTTLKSLKKTFDNSSMNNSGKDAYLLGVGALCASYTSIAWSHSTTEDDTGTPTVLFTSHHGVGWSEWTPGPDTGSATSRPGMGKFYHHFFLHSKPALTVCNYVYAIILRVETNT